MAGLRKKQRIRLIVIGLALLAGAAGLTGYALRDGIQLYRSPSELAEKLPETSEVFRLGGLVEEGTLKRGPGVRLDFTITDGGQSVPVVYEGRNPAPDLFGEGQGTIATGTYRGGVFYATELLAKHDESYMPKEVADTLKEQGVYRGN